MDTYGVTHLRDVERTRGGAPRHRGRAREERRSHRRDGRERSLAREAVVRTVTGAVAGAVATLPMTIAMESMHRQLPFWERHSLPPRKITVRIARRLGFTPYLDASARTAATLFGHFGYGAACGATYALTRGRRAGAASGLAFGLLVWGGSYLGWLPATGLMRPATEWSRRRNLLMIAAHVVWGTCTGVAVRAMLADRESGDSARPHYAVENEA